MPLTMIWYLNYKYQVFPKPESQRTILRLCFVLAGVALPTWLVMHFFGTAGLSELPRNLFEIAGCSTAAAGALYYAGTMAGFREVAVARHYFVAHWSRFRLQSL